MSPEPHRYFRPIAMAADVQLVSSLQLPRMLAVLSRVKTRPVEFSLEKFSRRLAFFWKLKYKLEKMAAFAKEYLFTIFYLLCSCKTHCHTITLNHPRSIHPLMSRNERAQVASVLTSKVFENASTLPPATLINMQRASHASLFDQYNFNRHPHSETFLLLMYFINENLMKNTIKIMHWLSSVSLERQPTLMS